LVIRACFAAYSDASADNSTRSFDFRLTLQLIDPRKERIDDEQKQQARQHDGPAARHHNPLSRGEMPPAFLKGSDHGRCTV
jgi:hypothetical protein